MIAEEQGAKQPVRASLLYGLRCMSDGNSIKLKMRHSPLSMLSGAGIPSSESGGALSVVG